MGMGNEYSHSMYNVFFMSYLKANGDLQHNNFCKELHFSSIDCMLFAFTTAIYTLIACLIFSAVLKWKSRHNKKYQYKILFMAKLFVFAIGGTGSRVVKALTMLLASGVKIENTQTIIPIIIDPDISNGDLTRTEEIIRLYKKIQQKTFSKGSFFFKTPYNSLGEMRKK